MLLGIRDRRGPGSVLFSAEAEEEGSSPEDTSDSDIDFVESDGSLTR
jgi:hypothetical protein